MSNKEALQKAAAIARAEVTKTALESAERIKRPYFPRVERFLYDVSFAQAALTDLLMEYDCKKDNQRITASYSGVVVTGGESSSKQERYTERMDFLEREIAKRQQIIKRYELALEQVKKVPRIGQRLVNLIKWKYFDGYDNETVWRMMSVDRSTYYRDRDVVVDTVYRTLPTQFLEQYKEG